VFGSSTGVEACYAKKPVILLGGTFYYHLDVAYIPNTKEEAITLIESFLEPKDLLGVYKFGFYLLEMEGYSKPIAYNAKSFSLFGKKLGFYFPHLKFLGSSRLHKFVLLFLRLKYKTQFYIQKQQVLTIPNNEVNIN
jgi:hypothetical protein